MAVDERALVPEHGLRLLLRQGLCRTFEGFIELWSERRPWSHSNDEVQIARLYGLQHSLYAFALASRIFRIATVIGASYKGCSMSKRLSGGN